jgi:hypothetical protein
MYSSRISLYLLRRLCTDAAIFTEMSEIKDKKELHQAIPS